MRPCFSTAYSTLLESTGELLLLVLLRSYARIIGTEKENSLLPRCCYPGHLQPLWSKCQTHSAGTFHTSTQDTFSLGPGVESRAAPFDVAG